MARCLNCAEGPTDTPCGKCESCKDLATGGSGSLDVVEIDAASHNGVDDARELRERAGFAPVRDRYKIFILDEAHMVTQQGFNALLKIVEEPPEHVKFIFATTEPDKVIGTIRSRTHHYPFRLVPPEIMEKYMAKLCEAENIEPAPGVLQLVMRAGAGSVRDSLSVLDQLMAGAEDGKLEYGTAAALLGYTDSSILERSVDAIIDRDGAALFEVIAKMVEGGHEPRRYLEDLLLRLRDLLVLSVSSPEDAQTALAGTPADQLAAMQSQAQRWGTTGISHASDLTNTALTELTGATAPRLQVELLAARLLLPEQSPAVAGEPGSTPAGSLSGAEAAMAALHRPGRKRPQNTANALPGSAAPAAPRTPEAPAEPTPAAPRANAVPEAPRGGGGAPELAAPRPQKTGSKPPAPAADKHENQQEQAPRNEVAEQESSPKETAASSSLREEPEVEKGEQYWQLLESWGKVSARLRDTDQRLWSTCNRHLQLGGAHNQQVTLLADTPQTVAYLKERLAPIEKCLQEELSDSWTVQVLPGSDDRRAPAMSEVLSRFKLDASSRVEKTLSQEAPPEEEEYPPEDADPADGSEENFYPKPVDGEANPASASSTSADTANAIAETADEVGNSAGKAEQESEPASSKADWIIANQKASDSFSTDSTENDQDAGDGAHLVTPETAPPLAATPSPLGAEAAEMAAPRPETYISSVPGSDNTVMAAPRDFADEPAAPRADQSATPFEPSTSTPLAAPREQTPEPDIPAAPREPAPSSADDESASPAPGAPSSYEDEDIPDLSDPDVSLDESGGRWGVEVAKSLLGGKIIETEEKSGGSGKAGI